MTLTSPGSRACAGFEPFTGLPQISSGLTFAAGPESAFLVAGLEFNNAETAPTPVPAALPLLPGALAGLALIRRRRAA
jgi:hypothetical protein